MKAHDETEHKEFIFYRLDEPGSFATWFPGDVLVAVHGPLIPGVPAVNSSHMYQIAERDWLPEEVMKLIEATGDGWQVVEWERLKLHTHGCPPLVEHHPCGHLKGWDLG